MAQQEGNKVVSTTANDKHSIPPNEISQIQAETFIQQADEVLAHTEDAILVAQNAKIHTENATVDAEKTDIQAHCADIRTNHAKINALNVRLNQEIDTLIQNAEEVRAEVVHAENVGSINASVVHIHNSPNPKPRKRIGKSLKKFLDSVEKRSLKETSGGVIDSYRQQNLTEPEKEFTPQLKKIDFYRGDWIPDNDMYYDMNQEEVYEDFSVCFNNREYKKDGAFALKETDNIGSLTKNEILFFQKKRSDDFQRYKAIVGQAGSGKTTVMKRIARDVIHGKLFVRKGEQDPYKPEFVHYLNIRDIPVSEKITPCDFLFGLVLVELDDDVLNNGFEWLRKNQNKAILFFDGLDQATWSLLGPCNKMKYKAKSSTSNIMKNILEGNLFPEIPIIISSREHTLSPLTGKLRPEVVIGLAGFTIEDRKQVFKGLAGEDGERLWNFACTKAPALIPLCSIPIFLLFVVIVYKFNVKNPPDTMSGVMVKILQIFLQSEHAHERDHILEILSSLKQMSFKGTREGRVLFTHKDLTEFNLIPKKVRDLVVFVPGSTLLGKNLMEGHYRLFFCHQSIQEMLTALNIIEMAVNPFTNFVSLYLHDDHWSVVRRFVCGVLLNEEACKDAREELLSVSEVTEKRKILKKSLVKELQRSARKSRQQLEIFACLYESNDIELMQSNVQEINIGGQTLSANDMFAVSSVLSRCTLVNRVRLENCNLNSDTVDILKTSLSSLVVETLDVSRNENLGISGCRAIGSIVKKCQVHQLIMDGCKLSTDRIGAFLEGSQNAKIKRFSVSNSGINTLDYIIKRLIRQCQVEEIIVDGCELRKVEDSLKKVGRIFIQRRKLNIGELSTLGTMIRCHYNEIQEVVMRRCEFCKGVLECFMEALGDIKMKILDVSHTELETEDWTLIGSLVQQCQVEQLNLGSCNLSADVINTLHNSLGNSKIKILNVSNNKYIEEEGYSTIGSIVQKCQVEELNMSGCELPTSKIRSLQNGLESFKIKVLNVRWNKNLDIWRIAKLQMKILNMRGCVLSTDEIDDLQEGLTDSKIEELEITMPYRYSHDDVEAIANLALECPHLQKLVLYGGLDLQSIEKGLIEEMAEDVEVVYKY